VWVWQWIKNCRLLSLKQKAMHKCKTLSIWCYIAKCLQHYSIHTTVCSATVCSDVLQQCERSSWRISSTENILQWIYFPSTMTKTLSSWCCIRACCGGLRYREFGSITCMLNFPEFWVSLTLLVYARYRDMLGLKLFNPLSLNTTDVDVSMD
jgi:hypothetical protein